MTIQLTKVLKTLASYCIRGSAGTQKAASYKAAAPGRTCTMRA